MRCQLQIDASLSTLSITTFNFSITSNHYPLWIVNLFKISEDTEWLSIFKLALVVRKYMLLDLILGKICYATCNKLQLNRFDQPLDKACYKFSDKLPEWRRFHLQIITQRDGVGFALSERLVLRIQLWSLRCDFNFHCIKTAGSFQVFS